MPTLENSTLANSTLANKVAIVTGASSGIGRAAAKLFAMQGARVVVAARREPLISELVADINQAGGTALAVAGDVQDEGFAQTLVDTASENFGGLDIAFNNAGIMGEIGPVPEMSLQSWNSVLNNNLTSAFLASRAQLPALIERGGGSIIFTSSYVGYTAGLPGMAAYSAAKAGLIGLTQSLAAEYGPLKIRVNALLPGGTDTEMARQFANTPETLQFVQNLHALKRLATADEIAQAALYLASDASTFTTGTAMLVDGGASINRT